MKNIANQWISREYFCPEWQFVRVAGSRFRPEPEFGIYKRNPIQAVACSSYIFTEGIHSIIFLDLEPAFRQAGLGFEY